MTDMKMELNKKQVTAFHNVNQELKNVFDSYMIFSNGVIISTKENSVVDKGIHFATIELNIFSFIPENEVIELDSESVFAAMRDHKKIITSMFISNNVVFFGTTDGGDDAPSKIRIGVCFDKEALDDEVLMTHQTAPKWRDRLTDEGVCTINLESIQDMLKANILYLSGPTEDMRLRTTKEIFPGLKKTHDIRYCMYDDIDNEDLFACLIEMDRGNLKTYHRYLSFKF